MRSRRGARVALLCGALAVGETSGCKSESAPTVTTVTTVTASATPKAAPLRDGAFAELLGDAAQPLRVELAIVPDSLVTVQQNGGPKAPYALAVDPNGPYRKALAALDAEIDALAKDAEGARSTIGDDAKFKALVDRYDALGKRVFEIQPAASEAVAIALGSFDPSRIDVQWRTVLEEGGDPFGLRVPKIEIPPITPLRLPRIGKEAYTEAERELAALEADDPPNVDKALPELKPPLEAMPGEVEAFNALVPRYNKELGRRRAYVADRLPGLVMVLRETARRRAGVVVTTVLDPSFGPLGDLALRTYAASVVKPARAWTEREAGALSTAMFASTDLVVMSHPTGADVTVDGAARGKTPCIITALKPGSSIGLSAAKKGFDTVTETTPILASPQSVMQRSLVLPKSGARKK